MKNIFPVFRQFIALIVALTALSCDRVAETWRVSELAAPYDLLPAGIYTREQTREQPGTPVSEHYVMRTFPLWEDHVIHGATNLQLSQAWALALAANLLEDREALDLVQSQLEWTLGRNPFSSSLMYGVGHNYAPHFVYTTRHLKGAIPVGIDCLHDDRPFWDGSAHATSHEIWIETESRFLGTLSTYLKAQEGGTTRNSQL